MKKILQNSRCNRFTVVKDNIYMLNSLLWCLLQITLSYCNIKPSLTENGYSSFQCYYQTSELVEFCISLDFMEISYLPE